MENACDEGDVHRMVFFQCSGPDPDVDPADPEADLSLRSDKLFLHDDLANGVVEATGTFFLPFELEGTDADHVEEVWVGLGQSSPWLAASTLCRPPAPAPGAYLEFYRDDTNGTDGWTIPLDTVIIPDARYGLVVRALDGNGTVLASGFTYLDVDNLLSDTEFQPGGPTTCPQPPSSGPYCWYHDTTPPYASVYRGDDLPRRDTTDNIDGSHGGACTQGLAFEYGEPIADFTVLAGGEASPYNAPDRPTDLIPHTATAHRDWGPGYCIEDPSFPVEVRAIDYLGNIRVQTVS